VVRVHSHYQRTLSDLPGGGRSEGLVHNWREAVERVSDPQTSHNDIWTVRAADGSDPVRVTDTPTVSEYAPTWQPIP
jgi:hypothetical protein